VWFAIGAFAAMLISFLPNSLLWIQVAIFVSVSTLMLILAHKFFLKHLKKNHVPTNVDAIIGKAAIVTEDIDNDLGAGRVLVEGLLWSARSVDGERIKANEKVIQ
jgi:membrane protein implicated in regulation of membrane protease activity